MIDIREKAARALCVKAGVPADDLVDGRPAWQHHLDTVDTVLGAVARDIAELERMRAGMGILIHNDPNAEISITNGHVYPKINRLGYDGDNLADSHQRLEDMTTHVTKNTYVLTGEERERLRVALPKARSVAASHGPIHPGWDSIGDGEALLVGKQTFLDYMAGDDITWLIESIERLAASPRFGEKHA